MRVAFVIPRYGPDILGGAETLARSVAERLVEKGWIVEVWTTCARNYHTWQNVYASGIETINGVTVHRFPALMKSKKHPDGTRVCGVFPTTLEAEYEWVDEGMNSPWLYAHLFKQGENFDYLFFMPYPFGFICYAAAVYPERSIIWPCLHDDVTAHFEPVRVTLNQARGIILNSHAERELLHRLDVNHLRNQIVGYGLEDVSGDAHNFYERYPHVNAPFMLYAGRLEKSKNVHLLIDYFINYLASRQREVNLVLIGTGPVSVPKHPNIFALGYVSEQDKQNAYAAATILCQPSVYESFGITILESWLHKTPVLVHHACKVTAAHCLAAQGGLYFRDELEFGAVLDYFLAQPTVAHQMGLNGRDYVRTHYDWDKVIATLTTTLELWLN